MRLFWESKPMQERMPRTSSRRRQRGNAIVELTLLTPLLFALALGVADFCRVFYASVAVSNAARAGAQYAISKNAYTNPAAISTAANDDSGPKIPVTVASSYYCRCPDGSGFAASCTPLPACQYQAWVSVTTSYTFNTMVNFPGVPNSTALSSTAQMRIR
jgi:Flp pilus assembly protein TadG